VLLSFAASALFATQPPPATARQIQCMSLVGKEQCLSGGTCTMQARYLFHRYWSALNKKQLIAFLCADCHCIANAGFKDWAAQCRNVHCLRKPEGVDRKFEGCDVFLGVPRRVSSCRRDVVRHSRDQCAQPQDLHYGMSLCNRDIALHRARHTVASCLSRQLSTWLFSRHGVT